MNNSNHNDCPLCGSNKIEKDFACKDHFITDEVFDIYKCCDCGFQFTQGVAEFTTATKQEQAHTDSDNSFFCKIYNFVHGVMLRRKANIIKKLTMLQNGKILDYGAKESDFANTMADRGWDTTIIKTKEWSNKKQEFKAGIEQIEEENIKSLPNESFDVITAWHVIEHIHDFNRFMQASNTLLDENGILILASPNTASYDAENYRENWAAYNVPHHLWHFKSSTMMHLGKRHGFILERRLPMPFDGFYISILSERRKGTHIPIIKGLWNGFLGWIASCDKCSASSSIIYVFRKKR